MVNDGSSVSPTPLLRRGASALDDGRSEGSDGSPSYPPTTAAILAERARAGEPAPEELNSAAAPQLPLGLTGGLALPGVTVRGARSPAAADGKDLTGISGNGKERGSTGDAAQSTTGAMLPDQALPAQRPMATLPLTALPLVGARPPTDLPLTALPLPAARTTNYVTATVTTPKSRRPRPKHLPKPASQPQSQDMGHMHVASMSTASTMPTSVPKWARPQLGSLCSGGSGSSPISLLKTEITSAESPKTELGDSQIGLAREHSDESGQSVPFVSTASFNWAPEEVLVQCWHRKLTNTYHDYNKLEMIGAGRYGAVFIVQHKTSEKRYACKFLTKVDHEEKTIQSEIDMLRRVDHPNIVRLYETIEDHQAIFLLMELCMGGDLYSRIAEEDHLSDPVSRIFASQMLSALAYCHSKGIVHRDVKPDNFLLATDDPNCLQLKLADFGIATAIRPANIAMQDEKGFGSHCSGISDTGDQVVGSYPYMAPELFQHRWHSLQRMVRLAEREKEKEAASPIEFTYTWSQHQQKPFQKHVEEDWGLSVQDCQIRLSVRDCEGRKVDASSALNREQFPLAATFEKRGSTPGQETPDTSKAFAASDLWSCGIVIYTMLSGDWPFGDDVDMICSGQPPDFTAEVWQTVSKEAIGLIEELLNQNMNARPTAQQALEHEWFRIALPGTDGSGTGHSSCSSSRWQPGVVGATPSVSGSGSRARSAEGRHELARDLLRYLRCWRRVPKLRRIVIAAVAKRLEADHVACRLAQAVCHEFSVSKECLFCDDLVQELNSALAEALASPLLAPALLPASPPEPDSGASAAQGGGETGAMGEGSQPLLTHQGSSSSAGSSEFAWRSSSSSSSLLQSPGKTSITGFHVRARMKRLGSNLARRLSPLSEDGFLGSDSPDASGSPDDLTASLTELRYLVSALDGEKNGTVDWTLLVAALMPPDVYSDERRVTEAFKQFDFQDLGRISPEDLQTYLRTGVKEKDRNLATFRQMVGEFDLDGDGVLDLEEFRSMLRGRGRSSSSQSQADSNGNGGNGSVTTTTEFRPPTRVVLETE